ncbi:MAG: hypothetical protein MI747_21930 [Desulfobacterales bacterium]|nr:hypothetical protein [Desulfobacterales bacterium]
MTLIISIVVFLVAVIGFGLAMKHFREKGQKTPAPAAPPKPQPKPKTAEVEWAEILEALLKLNFTVRRDVHLSGGIVLQIENIIDDLKQAIPPMMERYPGETLTYEVKKIGLSHLGRIIKEYLDLTPEVREAQAGTFQDTLQGIEDVIARSKDIVEKNETQEFKTMAHFLAGKFS